MVFIFRITCLFHLICMPSSKSSHADRLLGFFFQWQNRCIICKKISCKLLICCFWCKKATKIHVNLFLIFTAVCHFSLILTLITCFKGFKCSFSCIYLCLLDKYWTAVQFLFLFFFLAKINKSQADFNFIGVNSCKQNAMFLFDTC